jgi:hypothetical protein
MVDFDPQVGRWLNLDLTMSDTYTISCIIEGDDSTFPVQIKSNATVGSLKEVIREKNFVTLGGIDARKLTLYLVNVLEDELNVEDEMKKRPKALAVSRELGQVFDTGPAKNTIHIIVSVPPGR